MMNVHGEKGEGKWKASLKKNKVIKRQHFVYSDER